MWKNVNGVYTADPRVVPEAYSIPELKYDDKVQYYDDGSIQRAEDDLLAPGPAHEDDLGSDQECEAE